MQAEFFTWFEKIIYMSVILLIRYIFAYLSKQKSPVKWEKEGISWAGIRSDISSRDTPIPAQSPLTSRGKNLVDLRKRKDSDTNFLYKS